MATLVNKRNREVKVIIPNMREFSTFYSDNEGVTGMFFKRDWVEETTKKEEHWKSSEEQPVEGLNEAARHVLESWNGGTMDDVRRDMETLGNVLNARKEQPASEGLEEEMDEMWLEWCEDVDYWSYVSIARHFAEWGADHFRDTTKMIDEGLEGAAEEYEKKHTFQRYDGGGFTPEYNETLADAFIAGAEWQKAKMMGEAVAVEVVGEKRDLRLIDSTQRCLFNANRGDWLKIIIVKEDEK